ncbi:LacI family DNA-binding transcriptional regulator [Ideonella sp. YS5]|uniref:LacI family DNA-binding transcriptional regulator n=1 Tax=Ideonella sp. YS5 TaxID=3453714 RepID=UPI003EE90FCD
MTPDSRRRKAATLADVGREAGVSAMAASAVLNGSRTTSRISEETRQRVVEAAQRLGYRADETARALASRRTNTLGIAATLLGPEPNQYFLEVFNGVLQAAVAAGQNTTVFPVEGWSEPRRIARLCDGRIDGLILLAPMLQEAPDDFLPQHTPVVTIHSNRRHADVVNVESDEEVGAFAMVRHLLALGHRHILHVGGPLQSIGAARRVEGYLRAHHEAGIEPLQDGVTRDEFIFEGGRRSLQAWLERHRTQPLPTAVFAGSDAMAFGCIETLRQHGLRVPDDVSVAGFDDTALARSAQLATVRQPLLEIGRQAVEVLLACVEGHRQGSLYQGPRNIVAPTEMVLRGTVAAPRVGLLSIR